MAFYVVYNTIFKPRVVYNLWKWIMGNVENKINYFKDCIQVVNISGRYVPDLYHIILHVLIIIAIVSIVLVSDKPKNNE